jgi:hypothetical protein
MSGAKTGLWNRLFGTGDRKEPDAAKQATGAKARVVLDGSFLEIPSLGFFGQYARSPNGRFTLAWRDATHTEAGDARRTTPGRYLLIEGDEIIVQGRAERPHDGKVTDDGDFIINDWLHFTGELSGIFLAYRHDGSQIIARRFEANLYNNGLSADGKLAVCQTCNAPNEDGSRLTIFDLEAGAEVGGCVPESGWADRYEFPASDRVRLVHRDRGAFDYALDGSFLGREQWIAASLERGDIYIVQKLLRDAGEQPPVELLERLLLGTTAALKSLEAKDGRYRALAFKLQGTCLDGLGRGRKALASYDAALALDAKIGVKRRAEQLRKELTA